MSSDVPAAASPEGHQQALLAWFPLSPTEQLGTRKVFSEADLRSISDILRLIGRESWSRIPRIYVTLRIIDQLVTIDDFVLQGISDVWFPFSQQTLPGSVKSQTGRFNFLEAQHLVLSKALDLEKEDGKHRHFSRPEDVPFVKVAELGKGAFGYVDKVLSTISYKEYARKLIPRGRNFRKDREVLKDFEKELATLKKLSHIHIVELVGSYTDPKFVGIIMSPVAECNLKELLDLTPITPARRSFLRTFYGCLVAALRYLHEHQIKHKDVKPQNILVRGHEVYLTDFGISRDWSEYEHGTTTGFTIKTPRYAAPEVAAYGPRNSSADIWSLGCVFLEILTVLSGQPLSALVNHMSISGTRAGCYYQNPMAISSWFGYILETNASLEVRKPCEWTTLMLKSEAQDRCSAQTLFDLIQETNEDPDIPFAFAGTCCAEEDHSAESVISSIYEYDISYSTQRSPVQTTEFEETTDQQLQNLIEEDRAPVSEGPCVSQASEPMSPLASYHRQNEPPGSILGSQQILSNSIDPAPSPTWYERKSKNIRSMRSLPMTSGDEHSLMSTNMVHPVGSSTRLLEISAKLDDTVSRSESGQSSVIYQSSERSSHLVKLKSEPVCAGTMTMSVSKAIASSPSIQPIHPKTLLSLEDLQCSTKALSRGGRQSSQKGDKLSEAASIFGSNGTETSSREKYFIESLPYEAMERRVLPSNSMAGGTAPDHTRGRAHRGHLVFPEKLKEFTAGNVASGQVRRSTTKDQYDLNSPHVIMHRHSHGDDYERRVPPIFPNETLLSKRDQEVVDRVVAQRLQDAENVVVRLAMGDRHRSSASSSFLGPQPPQDPLPAASRIFAGQLHEAAIEFAEPSHKRYWAHAPTDIDNGLQDPIHKHPEPNMLINNTNYVKALSRSSRSTLSGDEWSSGRQQQRNRASGTTGIRSKEKGIAGEGRGNRPSSPSQQIARKAVGPPSSRPSAAIESRRQRTERNEHSKTPEPNIHSNTASRSPSSDQHYGEKRISTHDYVPDWYSWSGLEGSDLWVPNAGEYKQNISRWSEDIYPQDSVSQCPSPSPSPSRLYQSSVQEQWERPVPGSPTNEAPTLISELASYGLPKGRERKRNSEPRKRKKGIWELIKGG